MARRLIAGVDYALVSAWGATPVDGKLPALEGAYVFRVVASLFGAVAPPKVDQLAKGDSSWSALSLDGIYDAVASGGYVLHTVRGKEDAEDVWRLRRIKAASVVGRYDYLMSSRATKVELQTPEGHDVSENLETLHQLRSIVVFAGSEPVRVAPDPVADPIADDLIVLDCLYSDLPVGRWIIVVGERVDILDSSKNVIPGIRGGELAMIGAVTDGPDHSIPGDTPRTTITLASPLAYQYKRDTVHIYGNVVKASHGESTTEPLGSGNAATPQQSFELKRPPMTFTSAPTISGVNSSETVRVDGVRYDRVDCCSTLVLRIASINWRWTRPAAPRCASATARMARVCRADSRTYGLRIASASDRPGTCERSRSAY